MGKFDGYLLLSDFDGTLAHTEKEILPDGTKISKKAVSKENRDAIRYFQSEGGLFTLATGRQPEHVAQWAEEIRPNTYISALNGAYLYDADTNEILFSRPMDAGFVEIAQKVFSACPLLTEVRFTMLNDSTVIKPNEPLILPHNEPIYKLVFITPKENSDEYYAKVRALMGDDYLCMRSWINGIEVQTKGTGKGDSIARMKAALGERARIAVAVGDYENDLDMIRAADVGYAVDNAVPVLKESADRITVSYRESAIAKIIEDLEREC